jgi:DNA-directed RNA polymerase subunit RPC12/RpoP
MNAACNKCGTYLEAAWAFCPHCAAPCSHEAIPRKHELAPVAGGFSGLLFGLIAAPVLIIVGAMICLTGLGVFLGVPLVVLGVLSPLLGPVLGLNAQRGECPWCSAKIGSLTLFDRFSCPACSKRIIVRKRELLRAE